VIKLVGIKGVPFIRNTYTTNPGYGKAHLTRVLACVLYSIIYPMSGMIKKKPCQCYKCRAERGLEPLKVTEKRPAVRKDGHYAGCENRHFGYCHCRSVMTEWEIMHF
jgi:hypothetical protein